MKLGTLVSMFMLAGCQLVNGLTGGGAGPASSRGAKAYQYIFKTPASPLHLSVTVDKSRSAQAAISAKGGTISATAADGTVFSLEIPAKQLIGVTKITLTPLTSLSGLPSGGPVYAVQLEPEGLYFYAEAILTITPAKPIPLAKQLFITYQGDGKEVGMAAPKVKSKDIQILVTHFSGYGVTEGSPEDIAAIDGQLGGDPAAAIQSLAAEALAQMRQNEESGASGSNELAKTVVDLIDQWENDVVKPSLEAAGTSCQAGKDAMRALLGNERTRQLLGFPPSDETLAKVSKLMESGAIVCIKEEYQRCLDEHVINRLLPWYIDQLRERQIEVDNGGASNPESPALALARDLTTKCLTFELDFHSEGSFDTGDGGYKSSVDGKIALRFDPETFNIKGSGPLESQSFEFRVPKGGKGTKCTVDSKTGGGTFEVKSLAYVEERRSETDPEYYVRDFNMTYFPGVSSESFHIHCIDTDSQGHTSESDYTSPPSGYWSGLFLTLHQDELSGGPPASTGGLPSLDMNAMLMGALPPMPAPEMPADGGFFADTWDITSGDALIASKEWVKENAGINITETGTLKLYHKPGS